MTLETEAARAEANSDRRGRHRKYLPWAFTEHGAVMAANLLRSPEAAALSRPRSGDQAPDEPVGSGAAEFSVAADLRGRGLLASSPAMESHAVVFTGPGRVEYRRITSPEPGPADVVVDVHHSWISNGTEGSFLRGERISGDVAWRPGDPAPFPMVAGYQKVGRVRWVGADVRGLAAGDRVFASMSRVTGMFDNVFAGHVSPAVCAADSVLKLPAGVDPVACAGLVLTQVGYNCGTRSPVAPGAVAVVLGDGLVGQWAGQTLARQGARVMLVGRHEDRLARFAAHGATVRAGADHGVAAVRAWAGAPVQVLVETTGRAAGLRDFLPAMARGGHMVIAGFYPSAGAVDLQGALQEFRNSEISFDLASGATMERLRTTLDWVAAGRLDTLGLLTHRFSVERAAEAWELIASKREPVLGVVLDWPAARAAEEAR